MLTSLLFSMALGATPESGESDVSGDETAVAGDETELDAPGESELPQEPEAPAIDPVLGRAYTPWRPGQVAPGSKYWELEVLYAKHEDRKAAELAEKLFRETGDAHYTVFVARSWFQYLEGNEQVTDKRERMEIYERALAVLEEGIAKDPTDVHLKFAYGILMGRIGTTRGVLASLRTADDIENAWLEVINSDYQYGSIGLGEELPCDAYLALGIFYRLVPDSWIVKAIAGTKGDLDKSLEMQEKGVECAGDRIRNLKELAAIQMCIGTKRDQEDMITAGRASINRYLAMAPETQTEIVDMKHGIMMLKDPSMACGYSRDGQQDVDEANIKN